MRGVFLIIRRIDLLQSLNYAHAYAGNQRVDDLTPWISPEVAERCILDIASLCDLCALL